VRFAGGHVTLSHITLPTVKLSEAGLDVPQSACSNLGGT